MSTTVTIGNAGAQIAIAAVDNLDGTATAISTSNPLPVNSGGASPTVVGTSTDRRTAQSSTAVAVKASAGNLYGIHVYNADTVANFVQFYDVAQGSVTVGTTVPKLTFFVPASGGYDFWTSTPITFSTAVTLAATNTVTGGSAPSTALLVNTIYK